MLYVCGVAWDETLCLAAVCLSPLFVCTGLATYTASELNSVEGLIYINTELQAVVRESLQDLSPGLVNRLQYKWIHQRILSMEDIWLKAGRSLSAQYVLKDRKAKQVLYGMISFFFLNVFSLFSLNSFNLLFCISDTTVQLHFISNKQTNQKNHHT